jgi:DNA-directed RNA polymerase specialized sigma24 family protein
MSSEGSVTHWLGRLRAGDPAAAEQLWQRYFRRLVGLARLRLRNAPRRVADEEDVALSAFDSFCRGARQGRFPRLADRNDLWRLLVVITARKACDLRKREGRPPGGKAALPLGDAVEQVVGPEPTPEFAAQVAEEYRRLLDKLGNNELRSIAVWKMEGHTNQEVAARLGCAPPTVERRLRLIRALWADERWPGPG